MIRMHIGDVRSVLDSMEPGSVDLVLTSWPFLALRSYLPADHPDKALEIGQEPTPAEFLDTLLDVTEGFARVLAPHGSICTELGDTMAGSGGAGGDYNADGLRDGQARFDGSTRRGRSTVASLADELEDALASISMGGRPPDGHESDMAPAGTPVAPADAHRGRLKPRNSRFNQPDAGPRTGPGRSTAQRPGWPLDKSMCIIPHLYAASLAYGRNMLDPERSTDPWRVRNVVAWVRNNPPVGSLGGGTPEEGTGDARFRAATSYLTIACKGRSRWFDLDAVRTPAQAHRNQGTNGAKNAADNRGDGKGIEGAHFNERVNANPAGAPPLDWWLVNPKGYPGAHFATWPTDLLTRPIQAMCPRRVCRTCGVPSRRITFTSGYVRDGTEVADLDAWAWGGNEKGRRGERKSNDGGVVAASTTLGWTTCGCPGTEEGAMWAPDWRPTLAVLRSAQKAERAAEGDAAKALYRREQRMQAEALAAAWRGRTDGFHAGEGWRPGVVLDPFMGSGTTAVVASGLSRDVVGIDLDERNLGLLEERLGPLVSTMLEVVRHQAVQA